MFGELMAVAFALPITVEDKNKKDSIYRYITNNPGCNLSDIIKKLEMEDKIVLKKMSKYKKYYLKAETRYYQEIFRRHAFRTRTVFMPSRS